MNNYYEISFGNEASIKYQDSIKNSLNDDPSRINTKDISYLSSGKLNGLSQSTNSISTYSSQSSYNQTRLQTSAGDKCDQLPINKNPSLQINHINTPQCDVQISTGLVVDMINDDNLRSGHDILKKIKPYKYLLDTFLDEDLGEHSQITGLEDTLVKKVIDNITMNNDYKYIFFVKNGEIIAIDEYGATGCKIGRSYIKNNVLNSWSEKKIPLGKSLTYYIEGTVFLLMKMYSKYSSEFHVYLNGDHYRIDICNGEVYLIMKNDKCSDELWYKQFYSGKPHNISRFVNGNKKIIYDNEGNITSSS